MRPQLSFRINNQGQVPEVLLYDIIGEDWWTGEGVTAKKLRDEVKALGPVSELHVRINSEGGSVVEGMAIYNTLKELSPVTRVVVIVDGMAMSIASVIAMAGDEIRAHENATWMIHNAWNVLMGNADEMRKMAEVLDGIDRTIAGVYVARTGNKEANIVEWMAAETWMTAAEAKERGFVDTIIPNKQAPKAVSAQTLKTVRNAPAWVRQRAAEKDRPRLLQARSRFREMIRDQDEPAPFQPTLVLDFDGVLHSYSTPWIDAKTIPDPPVDGAVDFLEEAVGAFAVNVLSSRSKEPGGIQAMQDWTRKHLREAGKPDSVFDAILWPEQKPAATVTLDDRAITFDGTFPTIAELLAFRPWNKQLAAT